MIDRDEFETSAEDLALNRHLLTLKRFTPSPGFENRVLARVRRQAPVLVPRPVPAAKVLTARRVWWASGLAAASSTAWIVALASWLSATGWETMALRFTGSVLLPAWGVALQGVALAAKAAATAYALGNAWQGAAAAALIVPVLSTWGLYFTLKQPSGRRIAAYAAR
ncbi:MAG: hypothetical protein HY700_20100 [Gemmatimonadetes bacterium]|nr:hypothetical protein [Gemmatimonadota bacterium]